MFLGSIMSSETTAAAAGAVGNLRRDPFAMLPFCGYNMADYFGHWLAMGAGADQDKLPKIFYVNWFLKGEDGRFLWPGYGENSRVLEWVFERVAGRGEAVETPIGCGARRRARSTPRGSGSPTRRSRPCSRSTTPRGATELPDIEAHFAKFGDRLPPQLRDELEELRRRLG